MKKIKVLIVDDSKVICQILNELLSDSSEIEVVGSAENPYEAREMIKALNPDVITLDIEMPKMDGITFLKNLMRLRPMPVVMISTLTQKGADITLEALAIGAINFIEKPTPNDIRVNPQGFKALLVEKVTEAASANVKYVTQKSAEQPLNTEPKHTFKPNHIIAIGASTGGTEAITKVLMKMPVNCPPIIISQHIPEHFSQRFANRLNKYCPIKVKQAKQGATLLPGIAYVAPGNQHLKIVVTQNKYRCELVDSEKVNRHRPSVDVMFSSLVPFAKQVQAVLLTGMGNDGANYLKELKDLGATTIIQSKRSSLIWGMPGSAARISGHVYDTDLQDIAELLLKNAKEI